MKIRLKTGMVSADAAHGPGDEIDVDDALGARLIERDSAEAVETKRAPAPADAQTSSKRRTRRVIEQPETR